MGTTLTRRIQAGILSLVMLGSLYGCAGRGAPYRGGGGGRGARGTPGGTVGRRDATGGTTGGAGGITGSALGAGGGGMAGAAVGTTRDLGQQISDVVARMAGGGGRVGTTGVGTAAGTAPGTAAGGGGVAHPGVGVSTLVIDRLAFVGIDASTLGAAPAPAGTTGAAPAGTTGATTGVTPGRTTVVTPGRTTGTAPGRTTGAAAGGTTGITPGGAAGTLEDRVRSQVKASFPQVDHVFVSTDPATVHRLARVTGGTHAGAAPGSLITEMFSIATHMAGPGGAAGTARPGTSTAPSGR